MIANIDFSQSNVFIHVVTYHFIKFLKGIDLKVASKVFGRKFATGSSVTGNGDEIMIQGDVKDELIDVLLEKWSEVSVVFTAISEYCFKYIL